jgi:ribosomal protein S14
MKYLVAKDKALRIRVAGAEKKYLMLKALSVNRMVSQSVRLYAALQLHQSRSCSFVRVRNRCVITGRGRSVSRFVKLTRMKFREMASFGGLFGIKKASW